MVQLPFDKTETLKALCRSKRRHVFSVYCPHQKALFAVSFRCMMSGTFAAFLCCYRLLTLELRATLVYFDITSATYVLATY